MKQVEHDAFDPLPDLPMELRQAIEPHVERAEQRTQQELRRRFGKRLPEALAGANRVLGRFAPQRFRAVLRANPALVHADLVELLTRVDRALGKGRRERATARR